jgi:hypothetical protein
MEVKLQLSSVDPVLFVTLTLFCGLTVTVCVAVAVEP